MEITERLEQAFDVRGTPTNTRATYRRCIAKFERHFGQSAVRLGRKHVDAFLLYLARERKLSPSSQNVYAGSLKFLYAVVLDRPAVTARMPRRKQPMKLPVIPTAAELEQLLSAVEPIAPRTILMLAYGAGLRVSEACQLRIEDIDSQAMVLHIRHAKRGRERCVMLGKRLLAGLRAYWRARRPSGPELFPGRGKNRTLTRAAVSKALQKATKLSAVTRRVTPHTLRHCFATDLLDQGVDLRTVQVLLGHASIRSTTLYTHITTARVQSLTSPLDRLGGPGGSSDTSR